jgi:hypothetical protein
VEGEEIQAKQKTFNKIIAEKTLNTEKEMIIHV